MNYTPERLRMALGDRLPKIAEQRGVSPARVRKELVFERLLARLVAVAPDRWVLKGGLALDFRLGAAARTTRDMDLGRSDDEATAMRDFLAAQRMEAEPHAGSNTMFPIATRKRRSILRQHRLRLPLVLLDQQLPLRAGP